MHKSMMILFLLLLTSSVNAGTIYFRGEITHSPDPYLMGASVGDSFTGSLTYDLDTYGGEEECSSGYGRCLFDWIINVGPYYYSNRGAGGDIQGISVQNDRNWGDYWGDSIQFYQTTVSDGNGPSTNAPVIDFVYMWIDIYAYLTFFDQTGEALNSSEMPTPYELASGFNNGEFWFGGEGVVGTDSEAYLHDYRVIGQINNVSVPEPATILLFGSGLAGLIGFRIRRKQ